MSGRSQINARYQGARCLFWSRQVVMCLEGWVVAVPIVSLAAERSEACKNGFKTLSKLGT